MVGPSVNAPFKAVDPVQPNSDQRLNASARPTDNKDPAWFLPQGTSSLRPISAIDDPSLQGASPDGVASRILSHIGA
ncbi:MAG: hypothetical protein AB8B79_14070 [Granulosicoccus sp.]